MSTKIFAVISNFNTVPNDLIGLFDDFLLLDQSNSPEVVKVLDKTFGPSNLKKVDHVGHNLLDYLDWIDENFESLPELILFGKGNMVPRHIDQERLETILSAGVFSPLYSPPLDGNVKNVRFIDSNGWYAESNSSWYASAKRHRYFTSLDDFGRFLFGNWTSPPYVSFSPGGCYLVESKRVAEAGRDVYRYLAETLRYDFFPTEAYMVERVLGNVFSLALQPNPRFQSFEQYQAALMALPDRSNTYISGPGPLSKLKNIAGNLRGTNWRF